MSKFLLIPNLAFPIISIIEKEFMVSQEPKDYLVCNKNYIDTLNKLTEHIIDSDGAYYVRKKVSFIRYINSFRGFSIRFGGFGACFIDKEIEKLKELSIEELKKFGHTILAANRIEYEDGDIDVKKWVKEFDAFHDKENILRYLFFFADTSRFYHPDKKDREWREKRGFVKY